MADLKTQSSYAFASLILFLLHLPLLFIARGEFTDGVFQAAYFDDPLYVHTPGVPPARYVPPLYPGLIWIISRTGCDPLMAGRLLSLAAYSIGAFFLAWVARLLFEGVKEKQIAWLAWGYWALSPMANRWSFHCMSDMVFTCFTLASLACFVVAGKAALRGCSSEQPLELPPTHPHRLWLLGQVLGLAAFWTRYQGVALLAASLLAWWMIRRWVSARQLALALLAWIASLILLKQGLGIHSGQFSERAVYPWEIYGQFAAAAFQYLPYAVTPPLLLLSLCGMLRIARSSTQGAAWILFGISGGFLALVVQTGFLSFQFRYGLPLLPWLCLLAAVGTVSLPYPKTATCITALWLLGMTMAVIGFQHETFGDIQEACQEIQPHLAEGRSAWACEEYNPHYRNVKTSVWSGMSVRWLDETSVEAVKAGDLLVDSSVYPIPSSLLAKLRSKWKLVSVADASSQTIPLFPGEILTVPVGSPGNGHFIRATSQPELMAYRYDRQYYSTTLFRVLPREEAP